MQKVIQDAKKMENLLTEIYEKEENTIKIPDIEMTGSIENVNGGFIAAESAIAKLRERAELALSPDFALEKVHGMSTTFGEDMRAKIHKLEKLELRLEESLNEIAVEYAAAKIADADKNEIFNYIDSARPQMSKFLLLLLSKLSKLLEPKWRNRLNQIIAEYRNEVLHSERLPLYKSFNAIQAQITRNGLVPVTGFSLFDELMDKVKKNLAPAEETKEGGNPYEFLGGKVAPSKKSIIKKLDDSKISYILIWKTLGSAVGYNIAPYISSRYIYENDMMTKQGEGLTPEFIKRFSVPEMFENGDPAESEYIFDINTNEYKTFVFETLDGVNFRLLGTQLNSISVPTAKIAHLADGASTRPADYNAEMENIIVRRGFSTEELAILRRYEGEGIYFDEERVISAIKMAERGKSLENRVLSAMDLYLESNAHDIGMGADSALGVWARSGDVVEKLGRAFSRARGNRDANPFRDLKKSGALKIMQLSAIDYYKKNLSIE